MSRPTTYQLFFAISESFITMHGKKYCKAQVDVMNNTSPW
jgi:hypothetical protein